MTIDVRHITDVDSVIIVTKESKEAFKTMVHRALNLWPDAPPELKEFADVITNDWMTEEIKAKGAGKGLQDYKAQDTSKKNKETCTHKHTVPAIFEGHVKCLHCGTILLSTKGETK